MKTMRLFSKIAHMLLIAGFVGILLTACGATSNTPKPAARNTATPVASSTTSSSFHTSLKTSDGKLLIQLNITPDHFGNNMFIVDLKDASNGKPVTNEQAQIFTTMLDMDMGTGVVMLQENGNGRYSAAGDLPMDGNWDIHIQLVDNNAIHVAKLKVYIPA